MRARPSSSRGPASAATQEHASTIECSRAEAGLGGRQRSVGSAGGVARQRDRTLQEGGGGGLATSCLRPEGRALQLAGHVLVGPGGRSSQMPCAAIRIAVPIRRLCQCQVRRSPLPLVSGPVHGRARQRVAERHALPHRQQLVRCVDRGERDSEPITCALQEQRVTHRLGRGEQQQPSRVLRKRPQAPGIAVLDPLREITSDRHPEPAGQLRGRKSPGQLDQGERVAMRLRENPVADLLVQREAHRRAQQRAGVAVHESAHLEVRHVRKLVAGDASGEHEPDRLSQQPASDERERQRRASIEPLRVVDDAQQGASLGRFAYEAEDGEADQEPIRRGSRGQAEDDSERVPLWTGQPLEALDQRSAQLVQAREGQLHLRLDPHCAGDGQVRRRLDQVPQQRRLSDPRLAPETRDRLSPRRTSSIKRSSTAHSSARPSRFMHRPGPRHRLRVCSNPWRAHDKPPIPASGRPAEIGRARAFLLRVDEHGAIGPVTRT